jgi:hypothetical protein
MPTIADIRQKYPQYADVPDVQLADALHAKFYSDMPKGDFYKSINLSGASLIPGSITSLPKPAEPTLSEKILGTLETIPAMASSAIAVPVSAAAQLASDIYSGKRDVNQTTAKGIQQAMTYQPRFETGQQLTQAIGEATSGMVGVPMGTLQSASALGGPALNQLSAAVKPAVSATKNAMLAALPSQTPTVMPGMGAAETAAATLRQERAQRFGIPLTKGEQMPELGLQQFESDIVKQKPEMAAPIIELKKAQSKAIVDQFEKLAGQTGAEMADPANARQIGIIVDKALVNEYSKKFDAYKAKYNKADTAGETLQEVPYQNLVDYINKQTPTTRRSLAPILKDTLEQLKINDPNGTGVISIRALDDIYQNINKKVEFGTPNSTYGKELKTLINQTTEGAGGDLYREARKAREQLANDFENNHRVAKLLDTKGKYADRAVALDDVFKHIVLNGSLEEMRTVTKLLKKAGPEGQKAYAELQGQTVEYLKDQLTKNASGELSFPKLKAAIEGLDREGKLDYMFGKTGRDTLVDLKQTVQDALVKDPRAINTSNTGNVILRGLDNLVKIRFPGAANAREMAQNIAIKRKIAESVNYNALAPTSATVNNLRP